MDDVLIIGGGVIGLSLAWDLATHGCSVRVIDQGEVGREASWAGAGVLPPGVMHADQHPHEQLRGLSYQLHSEWAERLRGLTGIDTGYRRCGGIYLARAPGEAAALAAWAAALREEGIEAIRLSVEELHDIEPGIAMVEARKSAPSAALSTQYSVLSTTTSGAPRRSTSPQVALFLPDEAQLRNPRHLKALVAACEQAGVKIIPHVAPSEFRIRDDELTEVCTSAGSMRARQYCFTAGAWTGQLLARLGINTGILPIRGQIVLFRCKSASGGPITRIINEGSRYLVPRDDGRVLSGSTEEEVGFDKRTTDEAISELTEFARGLVPALREADVELTWAGLRPGSYDGLPYLGRLPGLKNAYVAAGHFRTGLFLSPATAVVMSQLLRGEKPGIDLAPFRVGR
jgi:glycine oxidase